MVEDGRREWMGIGCQYLFCPARVLRSKCLRVDGRTCGLTDKRCSYSYISQKIPGMMKTTTAIYIREPEQQNNNTS